MIKKYKTKSIELEAIQLSGININEVLSFLDGHGEWVDRVILIRDQHGDIRVEIGDWVVKTSEGAFEVFIPESFDIFFNIG